jgi:hypothetical protein
MIGAGFRDPKVREFLERWRDREFKVVLNRQILLLHLRTLRELGLSAELLKRWTLWLTSPETSNYISSLETIETRVTRICEAIPNASIICSAKPNDASERWLLVYEFLQQGR